MLLSYLRDMLFVGTEPFVEAVILANNRGVYVLNQHTGLPFDRSRILAERPVVEVVDASVIQSIQGCLTFDRFHRLIANLTEKP